MGWSFALSPRATRDLLHVLVPALVAGGLAVLVFWRWLERSGEASMPEIKNPTALRASLGFVGLEREVAGVAGN